MLSVGLRFAAIICALLANPVSATDMRLTIYADGLSCPGGCDAHVVFHPSHNGTPTASAPSQPRETHSKCVTGQECRICFGADDSSCMLATYRGGGPKVGTFDFTPAFYAANCASTGIPLALKRQCALLDKALKTTGYDNRINCIAEPTAKGCASVIADATKLKNIDEPKYKQCYAMGNVKYNALQTDIQEQRSIACAYTRLSVGGPNSKGNRWRKLLPGACRPNTFVGRDGLDCCSADVRFSASIHPECSGFVLKSN